MSLKRHPAQWPWHGLLVLILLGLAIGLWVATKRVNYEWRWERVPQYFAYRAEAPQDTPISGQVSAIASEGGVNRIIMASDGDLNVAFELLNARYNARKRTIISGERTIGAIMDIDEAIGSRIYERSKNGYCFETSPENWRLT